MQRASNTRYTAAVLGVAVLLAGCSTGSSDADEGQRTGEAAPNIVQPGAPGEPSRTLSLEELAALEGTEHGDVDVAFMQGMIHHHAQALRMTALVPERSESAQVGLLAKRIDVSQEGEIEQMSDWLKQRGEAAPELHRIHGHAHGGGQVLMPGMLSEPALQQLEAARDEEFDRLFLEFMIRHHQGALTMVEQLYAAGGGLESSVDAFARHVDSDQQIEIARMQDMLAARR
ncbi:MAG TPA: DUF305 domain-containing protein [Gaiellaceae bacterium]|nr:DUF305 domain-containing protein [Gaiellaceae bacterium]